MALTPKIVKDGTSDQRALLPTALLYTRFDLRLSALSADRSGRVGEKFEIRNCAGRVGGIPNS